MRIAVFGAGALGSFYGARLAQAGAEVTFVERAPGLDHLRIHGLSVESPHGNFTLGPPCATDNPADIGPAISCWSA